MNDKTLYIIALTGSILGLVILFILSKTLTLTPAENLDIPDGKKIALEGEIISTNQRGNLTLLTLKHTCTTNAIIFNNTTIAAKHVRIIGTLSTYKGQKEIIIDKIVEEPLE